MFRQLLRALAPSVVLLSALAVLAAPASGASCATAIIDDWSDNGTIDKTYPIHCYREAISALPDDLRNYSSAPDDIKAALQARLQPPTAAPAETSGGSTTAAAAGSGSSGSGGGGNPGGESPGSGDTKAGAGGGSSPNGGSPDSRSLNGGSAEAPAAGDGQQLAAPSGGAFARQLGDGGASLPVPLIVVASVAGVIALLGAAVLVRRQLGRGRLGA